MLETDELSEVVDVKDGDSGSGVCPEVSAPHQPVSGPASRLEGLIGITLLVGVLASTFMVLFGGVVYVLRHSQLAVHYRVFRGEPSDLRDLKGIWEDVKAFSGRGIIQLGLMLLVGLQVLRVVLTGAIFAKTRDRVFVLISMLVLALLAYGLIFESAVRH